MSEKINEKKNEKNFVNENGAHSIISNFNKIFVCIKILIK